MNVTQFSTIIKNVWNQLNLRDYTTDKKLTFRLSQKAEANINDSEVFVEVKSSKDVLDILKHFKIDMNLTETDINKMIIDNKLNTFDGICLILEIQ